MSSARSFTVGLLFAATVLAVAACGGGAKAVTPSALTGDPTTYDGQSVAVSGTAKNVHSRKTRRGTALLYDLCDNSCIHVFQFGSGATVAEGSTVNVTGTFRQSFGRMQQIANVLVVGGHGGHWSPGASPSQ